ncbi:aldolase [Trametes punicea]|nr:aldolase [Trametes punicea]
MSLENNRTLAILRRAEAGGYGVLAQTCYDANCVIGLVRAAERCRSPAIIQMFPVTLAFGKGPWLRFCLDAAHQASVPIAVHLDHATDPEHLELALSLAERGIAFDSIMVDASHADTDEENIALARPYVERAERCGIAVEVELGRLEGGEAGLRMISDAKLTRPEKAREFMDGTGARILAPSIGNLHGVYINPPDFRQDILKDLQTEFKGSIPLCLHGTDGLPDALFKECIANGISKGSDIEFEQININSWGRDPYAKTLADNLQSKPFPDAVEEATKVFEDVCERFFKLFGSTGKA